MKRLVFCSTLIFLFTIVMSCAKNSLPSKILLKDFRGQPANFLILKEGGVELKRKGWSDFHATSFGMQVDDEDKLRINSDGSASILCKDLTDLIIPKDSLKQCSQPAQSSTYTLIDGTPQTPPRSDTSIPYIVSPRLTNVLSTTLKLRWQRVPQATKYKVRIEDDDINTPSLLEQEVTGTELVYDGSKNMRVNITYTIVVETSVKTVNLSSKDETSSSLGFILLPQDERDEVASLTKEIMKKIDRLNLPNENIAQRLVIAHLYASKMLNAEAIDILENLVDMGSQETAIYLLLGELYERIALPDYAIKYYKKAYEVATIENNLEVQAITQKKNGDLYKSLGSNYCKEAIDALVAAEHYYSKLGDTQILEKIKDDRSKICT